MPESLPVEVFVLDDDSVALRALEEALACLGPVVASSLWSDIAGPLLRNARLGDRQALLVCDLELPAISGAALCGIVRRHHPQAKIILFADELPTQQLDADLCLAKAEGTAQLLLGARRLLGLQPSLRLLS